MPPPPPPPLRVCRKGRWADPTQSACQVLRPEACAPKLNRRLPCIPPQDRQDSFFLSMRPQIEQTCRPASPASEGDSGSAPPLGFIGDTPLALRGRYSTACGSRLFASGPRRKSKPRPPAGETDNLERNPDRHFVPRVFFVAGSPLQSVTRTIPRRRSPQWQVWRRRCAPRPPRECFARGRTHPPH